MKNLNLELRYVSQSFCWTPVRTPVSDLLIVPRTRTRTHEKSVPEDIVSTPVAKVLLFR